MARLEALITMGQRSSPQQPAFSPVKVLVTYKPPPGSLSQNPFIQSSSLSGQAGPASGPDGAQTLPVSTVTRSSPLDNLYPDTDPEPVFKQPGPVPPAQSSTGPVHFPVRDVIPPNNLKRERFLIRNRSRRINRTLIQGKKTELLVEIKIIEKL